MQCIVLYASTDIQILLCERILYKDLSYGEILAGQPGAWLVKFFFYMHAIKKVKKGIYVEIHNDLQNMFKFFDSFYGLWVKGLYWCSLWGHLP